MATVHPSVAAENSLAAICGPLTAATAETVAAPAADNSVAATFGALVAEVAEVAAEAAASNAHADGAACHSTSSVPAGSSAAAVVVLMWPSICAELKESTSTLSTWPAVCAAVCSAIVRTAAPLGPCVAWRHNRSAGADVGVVVDGETGVLMSLSLVEMTTTATTTNRR